MNNERHEIRDDEFRVISKKNTVQTSNKRKLTLLITSGIIAAIMIGVAVILFLRHQVKPTEEENVVFEPINQTVQVTTDDLKPLGTYNPQKDSSYTEHIKHTVNDIPLDIYIPHHAIPELALGIPALEDKSIILTTQAADIRADNGKIVGAFVLKGKPLSWGLSKKGYCGIINGKISVGVADNSPLFEEATETGGYFFRQYPLVNNGTIVENEPKGKSIRKALCDRNGEIMVVMTSTPESFHDFSQALVDLGVNNAIYLVGSTSFGYFRDKLNQLDIIYNKHRYGYQYENVIIWRRK